MWGLVESHLDIQLLLRQNYKNRSTVLLQVCAPSPFQCRVVTKAEEFTVARSL